MKDRKERCILKSRTDNVGNENENELEEEIENSSSEVQRSQKSQQFNRLPPTLMKFENSSSKKRKEPEGKREEYKKVTQRRKLNTF